MERILMELRSALLLTQAEPSVKATASQAPLVPLARALARPCVWRKASVGGSGEEPRVKP